ncbi:Hypothetical Protein FCC1311_016372 [Hondaea fermentalgiana]|uniref:Uncharacterized protein n=1 Tax=Hondaea fermentalgiana TaxID=2315210 RepID=A0A2R5G508_9STRA|nr:Hypothetical Protein FCC1311_016372 [Hondaea fermentalgiana]|eukprot:GBG25419.1 Hypothetical Protein FCC1311_016372 [Hondaea fermentalgiana]
MKHQRTQKLESLARQNPTEPHTQEDLGMLLAEVGDYEEAERFLARALEYGIPSVSLLSTRGHALYALQRYAEAQTLLQRAVNLALTQGRNVRFDTYARLARAAILVGDFSGAQTNCEEALHRVIPSYYASANGRAGTAEPAKGAKTCSSKNVDKDARKSRKQRGESYGGVADLHMIYCEPFSNEHLWALVSRAYSMMGRSTLAHKALGMTRVRKPEDLWLDLADLMLKQEDYLGALGAAEQGLVHCPFKGSLLESKCTALRALSEASKAIPELKEDLADATALLESIVAVQPITGRSARAKNLLKGMKSSVSCAAFSRAEFELDVGGAASPRFARTLALADDAAPVRSDNEEDEDEDEEEDDDDAREQEEDEEKHSSLQEKWYLEDGNGSPKTYEEESDLEYEDDETATPRQQQESTMRLYAAGGMMTQRSGNANDGQSGDDEAKPREDRITRLQRMRTQRETMARLASQKSTKSQLLGDNSGGMSRMSWSDKQRSSRVMGHPPPMRPQSSKLRFKKPPLVHQQSWPPREDTTPSGRPQSAPRDSRFSRSRETAGTKVKLTRLSTRLTQEESLASLHMDDASRSTRRLQTHAEHEDAKVVDSGLEESRKGDKDKDGAQVAPVQGIDLSRLLQNGPAPVVPSSRAVSERTNSTAAAASESDGAEIVEELATSIFEPEEEGETPGSEPEDLVDDAAKNSDKEDNMSVVEEELSGESEAAAQSQNGEGSISSSDGIKKEDEGEGKEVRRESLEPPDESGTTSSPQAQGQVKRLSQVQTLDDVRAVSVVDPVGSVRALLNLIEIEDQSERAKRTYSSLSSSKTSRPRTTASLSDKPMEPVAEAVGETEDVETKAVDSLGPPTTKPVNPVEAAEALLSLIADEFSESEDEDQHLDQDLDSDDSEVLF